MPYLFFFDLRRYRAGWNGLLSISNLSLASLEKWRLGSLSLSFSPRVGASSIKRRRRPLWTLGREGEKDRKQPASAKHAVFHVRVNFVGQTQTRVNNASPPLPPFPSSRRSPASLLREIVETPNFDSSRLRASQPRINSIEITKVNRLLPFVGIMKSLFPLSPSSSTTLASSYFPSYFAPLPFSLDGDRIKIIRGR